MKRLLFLCLLCFSAISQAQVFNNGQTLQPNSFSLGVNPVIFDENPGFFSYLGYGISEGFDAEVKYGMLEGDDYFGVNLEWALMNIAPYLSVSTGFHTHHYFGLDLTLNSSFSLGNNHSIYGGLDFDFNMKTGETDTHIWLPIGVELRLRRKLNFILETNTALNKKSPHTFGGGLVFFF